MSGEKTLFPTYRRRIDRGQAYAVVTLADSRTKRRRTYRLGRYGTDESRQLYARLVAEWETAGRHLPVGRGNGDGGTGGLTVAQLCLAYWRAKEPGLCPKVGSTVRQIIRLLRTMFGSMPAAEFGPNALRLLRHAMITGDPNAEPPRKPWSRRTATERVHRVGAIFKWAAGHELLPITVFQSLKALEPLGPGEGQDGKLVKPVSEQWIKIIRVRVSRQVDAMIGLQLLTGMRPGEVTRMRVCDLDMAGKVWIYSPASHKTAHHGHRRTVYLGPRSQELIQPFLAGRATSAYLFSPVEAEAERRAELHARRKTPLSYGNRPGTNRRENPQRKPADHYTTDSYRRAIWRACDQADQRAREKAIAAGQVVNGRLLPRWSPHQLRHNYATAVRRKYGLEAAQILLGHSSALVTEAVYAERDMNKAMEIAARIG